MATLELTAENFEDEVVASDKPVLVDFWAVWCGPCSMLSPLVDEVSEEHPEIKVGKVNTDEQPELSQRFEISAIPTLILFKDGEPQSRSTGVISKEALESFVS